MTEPPHPASDLTGPGKTGVLGRDEPRTFGATQEPKMTRPPARNARVDFADSLDVKLAKRALAESDKRIPYEQVRRELGLKKK